MITDEEYLKAVKTKILYEREIRRLKPIYTFMFPSHYDISQKAFKIYDGDGELDLKLSKAYMEGAVWMLDECIRKLEENSSKTT